MPISAQAPHPSPRHIDGLAVALIAGLISLAGLAWVVAGGMMEGMDTGPGSDLGSLSFYVAAWVVMMAAMMFPSISPMVRTYALVQRSRYARRGLGEPTAAIVAFLAGYLLIWIVFGLAAYATFKLAGAIDLVPFSWDRGGSYLAGGVILASAIYQLTPLKDACLSRCRGPLDFLTERWRDVSAERCDSVRPPACVDASVRSSSACMRCCSVRFLFAAMTNATIASTTITATMTQMSHIGILPTSCAPDGPEPPRP